MTKFIQVMQGGRKSPFLMNLNQIEIIDENFKEGLSSVRSFNGDYFTAFNHCVDEALDEGINIPAQPGFFLVWVECENLKEEIIAWHVVGPIVRPVTIEGRNEGYDPYLAIQNPRGGYHYMSAYYETEEELAKAVKEEFKKAAQNG